MWRYLKAAFWAGPQAPLIGTLPVNALLVAAITGVVAHVVALTIALRAGTVRRARLEAVLEAQRDEVVAMLERARIPPLPRPSQLHRGD